MKVVTAEQMRHIDQESAKVGLPTEVLMENAGKAVAEEAKRILINTDNKSILILVGPGNNGGDGLVAARYLHDRGVKVSLYLCSSRPQNDKNLEEVLQQGMTIIEAAHDETQDRLEELISSAGTIIDSIFGTGTSRPIRGIFPQILEKVAKAKYERPSLRIIAVDLPTGLNADTGSVDKVYIHADNTITLAFPKLGLYNPPGTDIAGEVTIADIRIPPYLAAQVTTELITEDWVRSVLPIRPISANKGTFGSVLVTAGSINYIGAAYLACSGSVRVGAGITTLATAASLQPTIAAQLPEVTYLPLPEARPGLISPDASRLIHQQIEHYKVLLIGCGLGQGQSAVRFVRSAILKPNISLPAIVLDADALSVLSTIPKWWQQMTDDAVLTPHPGEMARLIGASIDEVQSNRLNVAKMFAAQCNKTVVLKGACTVVASPDGRTRICSIANPGLASAGTGDVLSGVIAGLLAQGMSFFDAAACGVYLHAQAGNAIRKELGDTGMLASDLLPELPRVIKRIKEG